MTVGRSGRCPVSMRFISTSSEFARDEIATQQVVVGRECDGGLGGVSRNATHKSKRAVLMRDCQIDLLLEGILCGGFQCLGHGMGKTRCM